MLVVSNWASLQNEADNSWRIWISQNSCVSYVSSKPQPMINYHKLGESIIHNAQIQIPTKINDLAHVFSSKQAIISSYTRYTQTTLIHIQTIAILTRRDDSSWVSLYHLEHKCRDHLNVNKNWKRNHLVEVDWITTSSTFLHNCSLDNKKENQKEKVSSPTL
jgi:hypothetical protein